MLLIRCNIDVKLRKNKKRKICPAYVSKRNANSEIQVILLLISNRENYTRLSPKDDGIILQSKNYQHY